MQGHLSTLMNIPQSVLSGGIVTDLMTVFAALISVMLVLLGFRFIYALIKNESFIPYDFIHKFQEYNEDEEYQHIYQQEVKNFHINELRTRARNEIRNGRG